MAGYSILSPGYISPSQINEMITGTDIAGHGQDFIDAAGAYGLDPAFLLGLTKAEQTYRNPYGSNNLVGLTNDMGYGDGRMFKANDKQKLAGFATIKDGLLAAAKNLRRYADGAYGGPKTSVEAISQTWVGSESWKTEASTINSVVYSLYSGMGPDMAGAVETANPNHGYTAMAKDYKNAAVFKALSDKETIKTYEQWKKDAGTMAKLNPFNYIFDQGSNLMVRTLVVVIGLLFIVFALAAVIRPGATSAAPPVLPAEGEGGEPDVQDTI